MAFLRGRLPRTYAWIRTSNGTARRVTILFDTGASHCFINPRILTDLNLVPDISEGPAELQVADDRCIPCKGAVSNLQVLAGQYKQRLTFVAADIGQDDVILGGEVLELAQAGFGPPGFWRMLVGDKWLQIPLIGPDGMATGKVKAIRSKKKTVKLLVEHFNHIKVGQVRKVAEQGAEEEATAASSHGSGQSVDAERGKLGGGDTLSGSNQVPASSSSRSSRARQAKRRQRELALEAKIEAAKAEMAEMSAKIKQDLMDEFPDVFEAPETLPPFRWLNHRVELEEGARIPPARGLPRMSKAELDETATWLQDMLRKGWIQPSTAGHGARFFFVPKPNGKGLRGVVDFRALNSVTKKILPSLPLFENVIAQLEGAQYFSGLDLTSQFYQIRIDPADTSKTAFRTAFGLYEFCVTPMGSTGSVGTAMNVMQNVLQHVITLPGEQLAQHLRTQPPLPEQDGIPSNDEWRQYTYHTALGNYTCLFVDDIICYSRTQEDHIRHLRQICATLRQHHLFLNPDKCTFCQPEIVYLGNRVGRFGIRPTEDRVAALRDWPEPENLAELRSFLGLAGFLRRFLRDMAQIAVPLNALMKKGVPWQWSEVHRRAFQKLKQRCTETPVLAIPSADSHMVLRCDASREAIGVALYQQTKDGYLQPIEFRSKAFAEPQKKLPAHDREALALLYALSSFRHFLLHRKFDVQTDNSALSQIFSSKDMSDLYARWYHKIAEFTGLSIKHRPGRKLYCADALSRRRPAPGDDATPFFVEPGVLFKMAANQQMRASSVDAWHVKLLHTDGQHFVKVSTTSNADAASQASTVVPAEELLGASAAFKHVVIEDAELRSYQELWPELYETDAELAPFWKDAGSSQWGFMLHQGLLWKLGASGPRLCVPFGADKVPFLRAAHDNKLAAHAGIHRTLARAMGNYYWEGMYADVTRYVQTCHTCQIAKVDRRMRQGAARALPVPEAPWDSVHLDWITGLPKTARGFDTILFFVCALTGMVHLQACRKTDSSRDTAGHFLHNVIRLHGMPRSVISDRDIRLRAPFWRALQQRLGTELRFTTAHTPSSNGKVERINAVLGDVLRSLCEFKPKDWADNLDLAEFAINSSENSATGFTPFFANFAREPRVPTNLAQPRLDVPAAEQFADAMFATITHTRDSLERAKRKYEQDMAGKRRKTEVFNPGDKVLLATRNLNLHTASRKLLSKFVGPLEVLPSPAHCSNPNVVYLKVPRTLKIHQPINVKDIKRYHTRTADLGGPPEEMPEPLIVDGEDLYEVEAVLAERVFRRKRQVLVKWTGVDLLSATWEPIENIPQACIDEFRGLQVANEGEEMEIDVDDA